MAKWINKETPKRSFKISPIRWLGKSSLKNKSERYRRAMAFVDKADDIIRECVSKQKEILNDMKYIKRNLSGALYTVKIEEFKKEQRAVTTIIEKMGQTFASLAGSYGNINMAINEEVLQTPEGEFSSAESSDEYIKRITDELESHIEKEAFFGGYYWRTRTESGKRLAKAFETVYDKFTVVYKKNISTLNALDEIRDVGDPQKYLTTAVKQGFIDIDIFINRNKDLNDAIKDYFVSSNYVKETKDVVDQETPKEEVKIEKSPEPELKQEPAKQTITDTVVENIVEPEAAPAQVVTPAAAKSNKEFLKSLRPEISLVAPTKQQLMTSTPKQLPEYKQKDELEIALENMDKPKTPKLPNEEELKLEREKQEGLDALNELNKKSFITMIEKMAETEQPEILALAILEYADEIDQTDHKEALRLTAIAEEILNV